MSMLGTSGTHTLADRLVPTSGALARPGLRNGLLVLAGVALMAASARISVPLPWTPVPITMQTFAVLLIGALYGPRLGAATMATYLGTALMGMPVFAYGFSAWTPNPVTGIPTIIGPTAGYLIAFPFAAALVGFLASRGWDRRFATAVAAMGLGSLVILGFGFAWLAVATFILSGSLNIPALLGAAVLPFLAGDVLKLLLAAVALPSGWMLLGGRK
jgi:biotin transport system substrate-specific component